MKLRVALAICGIAACLSSQAISQQAVKKIVIRSEWGGYAIPPHRETIVEISRTPSGSYEQGNDAPVELSRVVGIVYALQSAPNKKVDLHDLGIDDHWL